MLELAQMSNVLRILDEKARVLRDVGEKQEFHMVDSMSVEIGHVNRNLSKQSDS